jgi:hypothetical protein
VAALTEVGGIMMEGVLETGRSHPVDQLILKLISTPVSESE